VYVASVGITACKPTDTSRTILIYNTQYEIRCSAGY